MGCFSFKCQKCGRGVRSSSFSGERVKLFLLKNGAVIQEMTGEYDSYGRVFIDGSQRKDVKHGLRESVQWNDPTPEKPLDDYWAKQDAKGDKHWIWLRVTDLMFDDENISNGIAAIHEACYDGVVPSVRSADDPNQGWGDGEDDDEEGDLMGDTSGEGTTYKPLKPVPNYDVLKDLRARALHEKVWRMKDRFQDSAVFRVFSELGKRGIDATKLDREELDTLIDEERKAPNVSDELIALEAELESLKAQGYGAR